MLQRFINRYQKFNKPKKSFSQSGEDLIIKFIFDQLDIARPSYLDIGAHHPFYLNNTALFYEIGCRGINIEPDPILFKDFVKLRKNDFNLNIGVSDNEGVADFYIMNVKTLNSFSKEEVQRITAEGNFFVESVKKIKVKTLHSIFKELGLLSFPQLLTIDTEGMDDLIIHSIDYDKNYPTVICIETLSFTSVGKGIKNQSLIQFLLSKNYTLYADTNINSIFVHNSLWLASK